ncbi:MAG: winged helix DNA-binding domain-containing protein [Gemmatimonadetes bacterium]|nr:winged helix DNA-binding domain-containing protein [Gemmatimonadota bacterium]
MKNELSNREARRIALAAQGFADRPPAGRVDSRHFDRLFDRVGIVQLDSVNVAVRTHYMPAFSRLGPYPQDRFDGYAYGKRRLFEGWGHEASLLPVEQFPLLRHRMEEVRSRAMHSFARERGDYVEAIYREVAGRGPLAVSDLEDPGRNRNRPWWGRSDGKLALEWLFATGRLAAMRRGNFVRVYDLVERVIPPRLLAAPSPPEQDAQRGLLRLAGRALGVGTLADLADYYRIRTPQAQPRVRELVEEGELAEVRVEGWSRPAYLHRDARIPRQVRARALLSPFDSLIWFRDRTERLFDFRYRIEIYVPAPQRRYGYYVFPFLTGEVLAGRVDLKADRANRVLLVRGAYLETGCEAGEVAAGLAVELKSMAAWLGLSEMIVEGRGSLAGPLRRAVESNG